MLQARAFALMLERFAVVERFDGRCQSCGGPARLVEVGSSVYVLAPGVAAPVAGHPAELGWRDGAQRKRKGAP